jgi:hypothetical protein
VLGARAEGYDPVRLPISRLAALGAPTRPAMTAALVVLGAGMIVYGLALRPASPWLLPVANGAATLALAALPLGGSHDTAHGVAAALGYLTLAAIPVAVGGRRPAAAAATLVSAGGLLASILLDRDGLFQRVGLTVAQLWVVVNALGLVRSPTWWSRSRPARAPAGRRR